MAKMSTFEKTHGRRPRVVVVGAGFGGLVAAKRFQGQPVDVVLIDKRNYHLFQPLLYQVATADLSPADVAWPIRGIFSDQKNVRVLLAKVSGIDTAAKQVLTEDGAAVDYDRLILATGAQHSYFGQDHWAPVAPGLKRIIDATELRKRILLAFERAEAATDPVEQRRQLNFVVVGGGPTGVEMAGAIAELAHKALPKDFRHINSKDARVILVEAGDRLLKQVDPKLSAYAKRALEKLGVDVLLGGRVTQCDEEGVVIGDVRLPAATIVWGAGVAASPAGRWLGVQTDRAGRVPVDERLRVEGLAEIFAVGDVAASKGWNGREVPGIAPAAKQGGHHAARVILADFGLTKDPGAFRYRHHGNLATIGRNAAVIEMGRLRLTGGLAWWVWGLAHITFLIGVRAPLLVAMQWFWAYLTFKKGARLITGLQPLFEPPAVKKDAAL